MSSDLNVTFQGRGGDADLATDSASGNPSLSCFVQKEHTENTRSISLKGESPPVSKRPFFTADLS